MAARARMHPHGRNHHPHRLAAVAKPTPAWLCAAVCLTRRGAVRSIPPKPPRTDAQLPCQTSPPTRWPPSSQRHSTNLPVAAISPLHVSNLPHAMDDFIQAFRRSQLHEREQALALLLAELNPYEWRALHAMTGRRTFQTDIIGRLPIELVAQIFTYLDPAAPFRCQMVSKQWHHVLSSLSVIKASLNTWYRGSLDTLQADYAFCKKIASTIHAFRTGHPRNVYEITFDGVLCNDPILVGDHLIWTRILKDNNGTINTSSSIYIFNLHDWQLRTVGCAGRERVDRIFASDQIVVMLNYTTTVYVCELHSTQEPKSFTIPSLDYIKDISCRGRTVACVATFPKYASVCIWNYDTQQGRSFDIKYDSDPLFRGFIPSRDFRICPLVQPETETIILVFVINTFTKDGRVKDSEFVIGRYTYRGECIASSRTSFPEIDRVEEWPNEEVMFEPADESDSVFTLTLKALSHDYYARIPWKYWIDEKTLDMRAWDVAKLHSHVSSDREGLVTAQWKDTYYGYSPELRGVYADRVAYMGTQGKEAYSPIVSQVIDDADRRERYFRGGVLLNGKYVIKDENESLCVLCFEDNGNRPKHEFKGGFFGIGWIESIDLESTEPENAK